MSSHSADARVRQRYVCMVCDTPQSVHVHPSDSTSVIRYACSTCGDVTDHEPDGVTNWYDQPRRE